MAAEYPRAWEYLKSHKVALEDREHGEMRGAGWHGYTRNQALTAMPQAKIVVPDYYAHASFGIDAAGEYFFCGGGAGGYGIVLRGDVDPRYVTALLNSKLLDWYLQKITVRAYQTAYMYVKKYIEQIPIKLPGTEDGAQIHASLVQLVETITKLTFRLFAAATPHERTALQRQIDGANQKIDSLVYRLYGVTDIEITSVEGLSSDSVA